MTCMLGAKGSLPSVSSCHRLPWSSHGEREAASSYMDVWGLEKGK